MNDHANDRPDNEALEQAQVFELISEHLITATPSQTLLDALEKRLENRIQASIAKHIGLRTIRSREGVWRGLVSGIRYKPLWEGPQGNSVLVEFAPGSSLPFHRHNFLEEGIVLSGGLQVDDLELSQFDYHVSPAGSHHGHIQSKHGALAYLRGSSLGQPISMFKEVFGGLLPKNHKESESIINSGQGWVEVHEGLYQKDLWKDGKVASRFLRLAPNTKIPGHYHPMNEECMLLSGDLFLGDILLQEGDYHVAPAGTEHLEIFSDNGALFYVRGAA